MIITTYPDGTNTQTFYDALGHTVGTQDQKGRNTSYFYDAAGRSVTVEEQRGQAYKLHYAGDKN